MALTLVAGHGRQIVIVVLDLLKRLKLDQEYKTYYRRRVDKLLALQKDWGVDAGLKDGDQLIDVSVLWAQRGLDRQGKS
jgi:hypothetical protein